MHASEHSVGVVGAGPLGVLFAVLFSALAPQRVPPILVTRRPELARDVNTSGIRVDLTFDHQALDAQVDAPPGAVLAICAEEATDDMRRDIVFILSRSFDSEYAIEAAQRMVSPEGAIVMLQNGLRGWQMMQRVNGPHATGVVMGGGWAESAAHVVWTVPFEVVLPLQGAGIELGQLDRICECLEIAEIAVRRRGDEASIVWSKVSLTVLSSLASAMGLPVHAVLASPMSDVILRQLIDEMATVARLDGVELETDELMRHWDELRGTVGSKGSAYSALERGQRLETPDFGRSIADRGAEAGIAVPGIALMAKLAQAQSDVFHIVPRVSAPVPSSPTSMVSTPY